MATIGADLYGGLVCGSRQPDEDGCRKNAKAALVWFRHAHGGKIVLFWLWAWAWDAKVVHALPFKQFVPYLRNMVTIA